MGHLAKGTEERRHRVSAGSTCVCGTRAGRHWRQNRPDRGERRGTYSTSRTHSMRGKVCGDGVVGTSARWTDQVSRDLRPGPPSEAWYGVYCEPTHPPACSPVSGSRSTDTRVLGLPLRPRAKGGSPTDPSLSIAPERFGGFVSLPTRVPRLQGSPTRLSGKRAKPRKKTKKEFR